MRRFAALLPLLAGLGALAAAPGGEAATHETRDVRGWTVHVSRDLLEVDPATAAAALELMDVKLYDVVRAVPGPALARLREIPIWLGREDEHGRFPCACYHPSADWLRENGYDPARAGAVDVLNAATFLDWTHEQPAMLLHELAHGYHDRVVGRDHAGLAAAYRRAVDSGDYDRVLHWDGETVRAYALQNGSEYFAELTEALFGTNDFHPFVRAELQHHDPQGYAVLRELWGLE